MPLNVSARNYRVWVCRPNEDPANWLDVTRWCSGDSGGWLTLTSQAADESGLIVTSGQLNLAVPPWNSADWTGDLDPWANENRWAVGNFIRVEVAGERGGLRPLPINHLYIISPPEPPHPSNWTLTVELGDWLTLIDSNPSYSSGGGLAAQGTSRKTRSEIVAEMLGTDTETLGDDQLTGYSGGAGQTAVRAAGELAMGAMGVLYQNAQGSLSTRRVLFFPERRLFKHVVGVDDAGDYQPLQVPLRAAGEVEVVSPESALATEEGDENAEDQAEDWTSLVNRDKEEDRDRDSDSTRTIETMSKGAIVEGADETEIEAIVRRESWSWGGSRYTSRIEETRARGLVIPEDWYEFLLAQGQNISTPSPFNQINALVLQETRRYEGSKEGRLLSIEKIASKTRGELFTDFYKKTYRADQPLPAVSQMIRAEVERTTYSYQTNNGRDSSGQVRKISTIRFAPVGQVAANATDWIRPGIAGTTLARDPAELVPVYRKVETWRKRSRDEWEYTIAEYKAGQVRSGTIKAFCRMIKTSGKTTHGREIQPPAAERRKGDKSKKRARLWTVRGSSKLDSNSPRKRTIQLNHVKDAATAQQIAATISKLDYFRERGWRITTGLRDEWFSFAPLSRVDLELNGRTYTGLVDQLVITLSADQAICVADCMRTGLCSGGDDYPYDPLPVLGPTDPTPGPLPHPDFTDPNPERHFQQAVSPTVSEIYDLVGRGGMNAFMELRPITVDPQPVLDFPVRLGQGLNLSELLVFGQGMTGSITPPPILDAELGQRGRIVEIDPNAPFAYWPLDDGTWTDQAGNNDLTAVETVLLGSDTDGTHADFLDEFSWLECSGGDFQISSADSYWGWRLQFRLKFPDLYGIPDWQFSPVQLDNGWTMFRDASTLVLSLSTTGDVWQIYGGALAVTEPNGDVTPLNNEWVTVEFGYNPLSAERWGFVNGIGATETFVPAPDPSNAPGLLKIGLAGSQIKEVKFWKGPEVPR